jgi:hypothetical protein
MKKEIQNYFQNDFEKFYLHYLPNAKHAGDELAACCPFHDDRKPSFSANKKTGVFCCHACGARGDIFEFVGRLRDINGDFAARCRAIAEDFGIVQADRWWDRIVETYDYTDENGKLLSQVCRLTPKDFRQRRPDGRGGWIGSTKGVRRVPYNLPEILRADVVHVTEGEKAANALKARGLTATCSPGGAGKWPEAFADVLSGKEVVIYADNDDPGRKHAEDVARSLIGKARSIKVLHLPVPEKADVFDFLATFTDDDEAAERLAIMAEGAPEYTPGSTDAIDLPASSFEFIHNADILKNLHPTEWRTRDHLVDRSLYYNFGDPGHFKTFVEVDRCLCIAAGINYHGHSVKQGTVFFIAGEGQQGIGRRTAAWHAAHGTKPEEVPFFIARVPTQLMDLEALDEVRKAIDQTTKQYGPPAVVHLDTLARNFGDGDENTTADMNRVISNLDKAFGNDFCRGLTHHTGHSNKDRARGSIALHAAADAAYRVSLTLDGRVLVECPKMKDAPPAPVMLFDRREVVLDICGTLDRTYVLDLVAEGDEAVSMAKPKEPQNVSGEMLEAVELLRQMYRECTRNLVEGGRPAAEPHVTFKDWRTACLNAKIYKRSDVFNRAAERMRDKGLIRFDQHAVHVYPVDSTDSTERWNAGGV